MRFSSIVMMLMIHTRSWATTSLPGATVQMVLQLILVHVTPSQCLRSLCVWTGFGPPKPSAKRSQNWPGCPGWRTPFDSVSAGTRPHSAANLQSASVAAEAGSPVKSTPDNGALFGIAQARGSADCRMLTFLAGLASMTLILTVCPLNAQVNSVSSLAVPKIHAWPTFLRTLPSIWIFLGKRLISACGGSENPPLMRNLHLVGARFLWVDGDPHF